MNILSNEHYREEYYKSILKFISSLKKDNNYERIKEEKWIHQILGYPLNIKRNAKLINKDLIYENDNYKLYSIQVENNLGIIFFGLFSEPKIEEKNIPLIIVSHGGGDSPESVFGLTESNCYNSLADYFANRKVSVFAPQFLLWNKSEYGTSFNRDERLFFDDKLKEVGGSITALEIFNIQCVIDILIKNNSIDKNKIGMAGHSYGGMYTLFIMAVDNRIKVGYSSSWFNDRNKYNWKDWTYGNKTPKDSELLLHIFPRKVYIEVGKKDEMFSCESSIKEWNLIDEKKRKLYSKFSVFDGNHIINPDSELINYFLQEIKK